MNAPKTGPVATEMLARLNSALSPTRSSSRTTASSIAATAATIPPAKAISPDHRKPGLRRQIARRAAANDLRRARRPHEGARPRAVDPRHGARRTIMATIESAVDADDHAGHPRPWRLQGPPHAPGRERTMVGPFIFVDQFGPARLPAGRGHGRAPAPAHQPRHRHLSVRRRDRASRQHRLPPGDRAGRDQPDDRGQRHRPFGALARSELRPAARASTACRPGSRCPTGKEEIEPAFEHVPADGLPLVEDGGASAPRADGHAVGRDRRRHRSIRRRSMPTSTLGPARAIPIDSRSRRARA